MIQKKIYIFLYTLSFLFILSLSTFYFLPKTAEAAVKLHKVPVNNLGLVGRWSLDGADVNWTSATAGTAIDRSGNANTGTLTNMAQATSPAVGKIGQALSFDGVNDFVSIANSTSLQITGTLTISAWIKVSSNNSSYREIFRKSNIYFLLLNAGNGIALSTGGGSPEYDNGFAYTADNAWHLVTGTFDGTTCRMYLDGIFQISYACVALTSDAVTAAIGANENGSAQFFAGDIDNVRVYSRALSASEIAALYRSGSAKINTSQNTKLASGLVGLWSFNGADVNWTSATAGTATDRSGNANTGTLTNMAQATSPAVGKIGQALKFDGSNDYVAVTDNSGLGVSTITVSGWIYATGNASDLSSPIINRRNSSNVGGFSLGFNNVAQTTIDWYVYVGGAWNLQQTTGWEKDTWYHIIATYDGSNMRTYRNGVEVGTATAVSGTINNPASPIVEIGRSANASANYINATLDDVRIYSRALSASEIAALYRSGSARINTSQNTKLASGLVGLWSFNGADVNWTSATAGTATDRSGNANTGTLTNMAQATSPAVGKIGQAFSFDGVNDYVNVGSGSSLNITGPITISAWVYPKSAVYSDIFVRYNDSSPINSQYIFATQANSRPVFCISNGTSEPCVSGSVINTLPIGQWTHLVGLWDGTTNAGSLRLYFDAVLNNSAQSSVSSIQSVSTSAFIGADGLNARFYADSIIDEVRVYNRALGNDEIRHLYNMGR